MHHEFLYRLSQPLREFVGHVEGQAGIVIYVTQQLRLNNGGPFGVGNLEIEIQAQRVQLFAPTNGYFPDGAVRHEVLHVQRFHLDGVPKLVLADAVEWDKPFSYALGQIDNAIEHIAIVPIELEHHPERRVHWEAVMTNVCSNLHTVPDVERCLAVCLHWPFMSRVFPDSHNFQLLRNYASEFDLVEDATKFSEQFLASSKEEQVSILFSKFSDILPRERAALEYINSVTGTKQLPVP
jgi:hypothetical protein